MQHPHRHVAGSDVQHAGRVVEGALDFGAGGVAAGVHDAPPRVAALAGQRPFARNRFIESGSGTD